MSNNEVEEFVPTRYGKQDALNDLDALESEFSNFMLPSSIAKSVKQEEKVELEEYVDDSEWMEALMTMRTEKKRNKRVYSGIFENSESGRKKKKKKKKKDGPKDHSEDFEREVHLLQGILQDQSKLSDSLQERYDQLNRQKSSARGVGKFTTDLISQLNTSRSLCKDIVKELASIKKTTAELNMKEREKFDKQHGLDEGNMAQFASGYLKQIMGANSELGNGSGEYGIEDVSEADDFFDDLDFNMKTSSKYSARSSDANNYLKYENLNVSVKVLYDEETDTRTFFAETEDGDILDDYPLPKTSDSLSINRSTNIATDKFGQKFDVVYN